MRELVFDLRDDDYLPKSGFGGFEGEHNATGLTLHLPERLLAPDAVYYMVFETEKNGEVIFSAPLLPDGGAIHTTLPRQVMLAPRISVHAAAYRKSGEELVEIAKSARAVLEIKYPEGETQRELSVDGGEIPGLVIESAVLPESENPVSSRALYGELSALAGERVEGAFVNGAGELILEKKNQSQLCAGNVVGPKGERGEQGAKGERGEQGPQGEKGEAGKDADPSVLANALKKTVSGAAIVLKDVSPLEHGIKVNLSNYDPLYDYNNDGVLDENDANRLNYHVNFPNQSDYQIPNDKSGDVNGDGAIDLHDVTALQYIAKLNCSAVTLTRYGKNLIDQEKFVDTSIPSSRMNACVKNENGNFYIEKSSEQSHFSAAAPVRIQPNTTFTLSFDLVSFSLNKEDGTLYPLIGVEIHFADGTYINTASDRISETGKRKIKTLTYQKEVTKLKIYIVPEPVVGSFIEFRDFQVELGGIATEYEPYKEPVSYTPNADGTVDGVKSLYPTTTLLTDTEGVNVTAEYNRDLNKAMEEIYQAIATIGASAVTIPEEA